MTKRSLVVIRPFGSGPTLPTPIDCVEAPIAVVAKAFNQVGLAVK